MDSMMLWQMTDLPKLLRASNFSSPQVVRTALTSSAVIDMPFVPPCATNQLWARFRLRLPDDTPILSYVARFFVRRDFLSLYR